MCPNASFGRGVQRSGFQSPILTRRDFMSCEEVVVEDSETPMQVHTYPISQHIFSVALKEN